MHRAAGERRRRTCAPVGRDRGSRPLRRIAGLLLGAALVAVAALAAATWHLIAPQPAPAGPPPPGLGVEAIGFDSPSGSRIAGWFASGRTGAGAVLLLHGVRATRASMTARMAWLAREGYAVLAVDLQAHGESPGRFITFGRREALDAAAAVAILRARLPGERIGAIGASLGGAAALLGTEPLAVDALVLEAVYPDIRSAVANRLAIRLGEVGRRLTPLIEAAARLMTGLSPDELRPIDRIGAARAPILVAAGAEDRHTTAAETQAMFVRATGMKQLWMVPGVAHVDLHAAAPAAYEATVGAFLSLHLR
ncbi:MAG: alpha/beta fold hydrolase [Alphaproteobacteria bacterium]|nr:alpha/beta fold hydrolase [Alphaproteobacteria bacterium]